MDRTHTSTHTVITTWFLTTVPKTSTGKKTPSAIHDARKQLSTCRQQKLESPFLTLDKIDQNRLEILRLSPAAL